MLSDVSARASDARDELDASVGRDGGEGTVVHVDGLVLAADARFAEVFGVHEPGVVIGTSIFDFIKSEAGGALLMECTRLDGTAIQVATASTPVDFERYSAREVKVGT